MKYNGTIYVKRCPDCGLWMVWQFLHSDNLPNRWECDCQHKDWTQGEVDEDELDGNMPLHHKIAINCPNGSAKYVRTDNPTHTYLPVVIVPNPSAEKDEYPDVYEIRSHRFKAVCGGEQEREQSKQWLIERGISIYETTREDYGYKTE